MKCQEEVTDLYDDYRYFSLFSYATRPIRLTSQSKLEKAGINNVVLSASVYKALWTFFWYELKISK